MLVIPKDSLDTCSIIGIDPGSSHIGISILIIDICTWTIVSSTAFTINAGKLVPKDSYLANIHGDRYSRIQALENSLYTVFKKYNPNIIVSESPFINSRFPLAGMALTEVMFAIRTVVFMYDLCIPLSIIPPSNVKQAISAPGNATKDIMLTKLIELSPILKYNGNIPLELLDEHSVDSLAVAYFKYIEIKNWR